MSGAGYRPITDMMILARPKISYYGAFPSGFLERARHLLVPYWEPVLHVCGGMVRDYPFKGFGPHDKTVDLNPACKPDFLMDVRRMGTAPGDLFPARASPHPMGKPAIIEVQKDSSEPFVDHLWPAVLCDRPYTEEDAAKYDVGAEVLPEPNDLLRRALSITRPGGRVGFLDYFIPRPPKDVRFVAILGVFVGFGNRIRAYSVFEKPYTDAKRVPLDKPAIDERGRAETTLRTLTPADCDPAIQDLPPVLDPASARQLNQIREQSRGFLASGGLDELMDF